MKNYLKTGGMPFLLLMKKHPLVGHVHAKTAWLSKKKIPILESLKDLL
jgi:hypothetical protein